MLRYEDICEGLTAEIELLKHSKEAVAKLYEEN
jgi:hypothetical protein